MSAPTDTPRTTPVTSWSDVVADAPELAAAVRDRFARHLHHVLGTVRADGSPRLSGTEVTFDGADVAEGNVTVGMMPGSRKLADVRRDPRVEIHAAPLDTELAAGDARLSGRLVDAGHVPIDGEGDGPPGSLFVLDVERVVLVRVDGDELVVSSWTPAEGPRVVRRR